MNYVLSVSNGHNLSNVRRATEELIEDFRRVVALCHTAPEDRRPRINCGLATAFGCTIEGDVDEDRVRRIADEVAEAGADGIMLADTVGYGQPAAIERVFRKVIADVAPLPVGGAFPRHARARPRQRAGGLECRRRAFDASLGGLGGCPYAPGATGNIVMEDTVFMFESMGCDTGDRPRPAGRGARDRRTAPCPRSRYTAPSPKPGCRTTSTRCDAQAAE